MERDGLWSIKYTPEVEKDILINKQKATQIKEFLQNALVRNLPDSRKVLFLSGPPGCGKSSTIKSFCHSYGVSIKRWGDQAVGRDFLMDLNEFLRYETLLREQSRRATVRQCIDTVVQEKLTETANLQTRVRPLMCLDRVEVPKPSPTTMNVKDQISPSSHPARVLLYRLSEILHAVKYSGDGFIEAFVRALARVGDTGPGKAVIILMDDNSREEFLMAKKIMHNKLIKNSVVQISLNPYSATACRQVLMSVWDKAVSAKLAIPLPPSRLQILVQDIIARTNGDLTKALSELQMESRNSSLEGKRKHSPLKLVHAGGRDERRDREVKVEERGGRAKEREIINYSAPNAKRPKLEKLNVIELLVLSSSEDEMIFQDLQENSKLKDSTKKLGVREGEGEEEKGDKREMGRKQIRPNFLEDFGLPLNEEEFDETEEKKGDNANDLFHCIGRIFANKQIPPDEYIANDRKCLLSIIPELHQKNETIKKQKLKILSSPFLYGSQPFLSLERLVETKNNQPIGGKREREREEGEERGMGEERKIVGEKEKKSGEFNSYEFRKLWERKFQYVECDCTNFNMKKKEKKTGETKARGRKVEETGNNERETLPACWRCEQSRNNHQKKYFNPDTITDPFAIDTVENLMLENTTSNFYAVSDLSNFLDTYCDMDKMRRGLLSSSPWRVSSFDGEQLFRSLLKADENINFMRYDAMETHLLSLHDYVSLRSASTANYLYFPYMHQLLASTRGTYRSLDFFLRNHSFSLSEMRVMFLSLANSPSLSPVSSNFQDEIHETHQILSELANQGGIMNNGEEETRRLRTARENISLHQKLNETSILFPSINFSETEVLKFDPSISLPSLLKFDDFDYHPSNSTSNSRPNEKAHLTSLPDTFSGEILMEIDDDDLLLTADLYGLPSPPFKMDYDDDPIEES